MSMWCEKCNKVTYGKKCDFCGHTNTEKKTQKNKTKKINKKTKNIKMTECNVCNEQIAVKATSCPHCGDTKTKNLVWKIIKIIILVWLFFWAISALVTFLAIGTVATVYKKEIKETSINLKNIKMPVVKTPSYKPIEYNFKQKQKEKSPRERYNIKVKKLQEKERARKKEELLRSMKL